MTLSEAFRIQAAACTALGSPFMARLLTLLAGTWPEDTGLAAACRAYSGDIGPSGSSLPLRIAGGLHGLVLTGRDPALAKVYPPNHADDDALGKTVLDALHRNEDFLVRWIASPPQTNEVRRSAAMIPAAHWIAARHPLPFVLSELGASAGLNLMFDRFALAMPDRRLGPENAALTLAPDWSGPVPPASPLTVEKRRGVDINPLDIHHPQARLRLFAYLWPDQPHRADLTRAAIACHDAMVDRADAIDWLESRLALPRPGRVHLVYHTVAWQYFPADAQARGRALIEAAGARATSDAPLAWLGMEADGKGDGAGLTLRLWPGDLRIDLARVDFHGRWVRWVAPVADTATS